MKIARFGQPALGALAVLLISGAGIAFAGNGAPTPAPAVAAPAVVTPAAAPVAAPEAAAPAAEPVEPVGVDTDTLQGGDQATPDAAVGQATEKAGAEEPGDANLPGGGHADDPDSASADHQFGGVE